MLTVHGVKRFWRRLNVAEQEVIIEEAQPSDAKALIDLLNQVNAETDFMYPKTVVVSFSLRSLISVLEE